MRLVPLNFLSASSLTEIFYSVCVKVSRSEQRIDFDRSGEQNNPRRFVLQEERQRPIRFVPVCVNGHLVRK